MIWLIGCKGMLGYELSLLFEKSGIKYTGTDRDIDITDSALINEFCKNKSLNWIINCAAYTAVDSAQDNEDACRDLNVKGAANIASYAKNTGASFIHISTDYVFNGKGNLCENSSSLRPYREDDITSPISVYGLSKLDGEKLVVKLNPMSYIIRTSWLYGKYGKNFVLTMLKLFSEQNEIKVVNDQRGSPTWTLDLCAVILELIKSSDNGKIIPFGIYHYTNEGETTWFDFAQEIYRLAGKYSHYDRICKIIPCSSDEYPQKAKRPVYSVLDKEKIKSNLGINIPVWEKSLKEFIKTCDL